MTFLRCESGVAIAATANASKNNQSQQAFALPSPTNSAKVGRHVRRTFMGRVFTLDEIERRQVPLHSNFTELAGLIRAGCTSPLIDAALIFGSYLKADR
ncbi:MAG: hypothetical protein NUV56_01900, partial [Candidatus Uhrbacteria bacterium]|nr:hypothetical protein [Candidatus Uhrbacteria bacterium]